MGQTVPVTPIVELYDDLHARGVGRQARLACARRLNGDPGTLADLFSLSVRALERYRPNDEGFYRSRTYYEVGQKRASSTTDVALRIRDAGGLTAIAAPDAPSAEPPVVSSVPTVTADRLACVYLNRELVATRTTGGASHPGTAVRLDLLLCNTADRTPVIAEIKRTSAPSPVAPHRVPATDKDPFSALIQALACTAQLATPAQYTRIARWGRANRRGDRDVPGPVEIADADIPVFDVYIILHNRPTGTYQAELAAETPRLAANLLSDQRVARHVRRIACLLTRNTNIGIRAHLDWAYQRAMP